MAMEPVKATCDGEVRVLSGWVSCVSNQCIYPGFVSPIGEPAGVQVSDDCGCINMVSVAIKKIREQKCEM